MTTIYTPAKTIKSMWSVTAKCLFGCSCLDCNWKSLHCMLLFLISFTWIWILAFLLKILFSAHVLWPHPGSRHRGFSVHQRWGDMSTLVHPLWPPMLASSQISISHGSSFPTGISSFHSDFAFSCTLFPAVIWPCYCTSHELYETFLYAQWHNICSLSRGTSRYFFSIIRGFHMLIWLLFYNSNLMVWAKGFQSNLLNLVYF